MSEKNMAYTDTYFYKFSSKLDKFNRYFNKILYFISILLLFILMFLTSADVIGRYFFSNPIIGIYELTELFLAIIIFFSLGSVQIKREHLEIDFLTNKLPSSLQNIISLFSHLLVLILLSLLTWQLFLMAMATNQTSGDLGLPLDNFLYLISIGSLAFTMSFLIEVINAFLKVVYKNEQ